SGYGATHLTVIDSVVQHNEAIGGSGNTGSGDIPFVGTGLGGGIANSRGASIDIRGSSILHNRAVGGAGNTNIGGPFPAGLGAGGGVFNALGNFRPVTGGFLAPASSISATAGWNTTRPRAGKGRPASVVGTPGAAPSPVSSRPRPT